MQKYFSVVGMWMNPPAILVVRVKNVKQLGEKRWTGITTEIFADLDIRRLDIGQNVYTETNHIFDGQDEAFHHAVVEIFQQ